MTKTTAIRERPIIFSAPMVRAILAGTKTQTRRVVKPVPDHSMDAVWITCNCPFGAPGDTLWVRERFYIDLPPWSDGGSLPSIRPPEIDDDQIYYPADARSGIRRWCCEVIPECACAEIGPAKARSPIHMPRWASRITLEITDVRVQRLREISAKDIIAEGAVDRPHHVDGLGKCPVSAFDRCVYPDLQSLWVAGWNKINGKKSGCAWSDNPFCWALTFRKI